MDKKLKFYYIYNRDSAKTEFTIPLELPEEVSVRDSSYFEESDSKFHLEEIAETLNKYVRWLIPLYNSEKVTARFMYETTEHTDHSLSFLNAIMRINTVKDNNECICVKIKKIEFTLKDKVYETD